jgi:hypothetical protein
MDSKAQYFVHFDIFACKKLDLTHYYYWLFLFNARGTLLALKALIKINTFTGCDGCSSDSHKKRHSG